MPEITLEVLSLDAVPLPERHCLFTGLGGTIGRDEGNTLVLQDKHRRVSRLHASITFPEGLPTIANASTSLPVTVGSTVLAYGQKMQLSGGDLIEIGPFLLRVRPPAATEVDDALQAHMQPTILAAAIHRPATPKPPVVPMEPVQPIVLGADPFADLFADMTPAVPATSAPSEPEIRHEPTLRPEVFQHPPGSTATSIEPDLFADLLGLGGPPAGGNLPSTAPVGGDPFAAYSQHVEPVAAAYHPMEPPPERTPLAIIPEDFNPFELPSQTSRNAADPLAQMLGGESAQSASSVIANEPSIDALFAPSGTSPFESVAGAGSSGSAYPAQSLNGLALPTDSSDPMLLFGAPAFAAEMPMRSPMRDDLAEIGGAYQPPRAFIPDSSSAYREQQSARPVAGQVQSGTGLGASPDALTLAFLKGTGLPANALPGGLTPEIMTVIGGLLRTATAGAIDMLAARAATKLEVQASVTIISAQSNNPLKFLPNAESALQQMLGKRMPGFMRADEAMRDAFDDLRAHEVGVIAGTRAALTEVLGRFDPALLEKRLTRGSLIDSLLPSIQKARLWEIYLEQYAKIRREAEDDFQSVFGRSFLAAYEQETARVKAHTTESGK